MYRLLALASEPSTYGGLACGSIALASVLDHVPEYLWAGPYLVALAVVCACIAVVMRDPGHR